MGIARQDDSHFDVIVLGQHPASYLAAALFRAKSSGKSSSALKVLHAELGSPPPPDRLVLINPAFFDLNPILSGLRRKLDLTPIYGLQFLSDDMVTRSEHRAKAPMALVGDYEEVRAVMIELAEALSVPMARPKDVTVQRLDEAGVELTVDDRTVFARALLVAALPSPRQSRPLGLPDAWDEEVLHCYCFGRLIKECQSDLGARPAAPMSLDLKQTLCWAWLLPHSQSWQVSVAIPIGRRQMPAPQDLLAHWIAVLRRHGMLNGQGGPLPVEQVHTLQLPLAGAMAQEGVANHTLLIGPAGGFYSACAEDIHPNCWSALFAVDAMRKALKEPHLQDGLQVYRHKWRTTLGDYLRGPQQNLRFLLPLVYRNQVMTTRLTESILQGKSVVR